MTAPLTLDTATSQRISRAPTWLAALRTILLAVLLALGVRTFVAEPFSIPSASMQPTLMAGDFILVAKYPYGYSRASFPFRIAPIEGRIGATLPSRGDVIVFTDPAGGEMNFVKRVIGLPGDRIRMAAGVLFLNDEPVPRRRIADSVVPISPNTPCEAGRQVGDECVFRQYVEELPGHGPIRTLHGPYMAALDDTDTFIVPDNSLFVMGDNRDNSEDSRAPQGFGMVPLQNLVGRASISFLSLDGSARLDDPGSWIPAVRFDRIGRRL
ncbi:signal peptidase I [Pacificimonas sp. ICDLI1SI03]